MGHYAAVWDHKAATEMTKDWNGIDQVFLRNPHGASAKVSTFFSLVFMSLLKSSFFKINVFVGFGFGRLVYMEDTWFHGGMTKAKSSFSLATRYVCMW